MAGELSFDLALEPWLPVRFTDGRSGSVGLAEALTRAHEISGLDIEFPTQEPPILRLLLACCYRAFGGPADDTAWRKLWEAPVLPTEVIEAYFERWADRFDLFDSEAPFFQSPGLGAVGGGGPKTANKLISYAPSGNNVPLFTPVTDATGLALSAAEAGRWLVERHAWGTTSDKTGAEGNPKVKAGKDAPQVGHVGWIGFVAPIGPTLRETLLLNLVPWSRTGFIRGGSEDLPAWERPPLGPMHETRPPEGVCDLYTWQGRRIRLCPEMRADEVVVTGVVICAGDSVDREAARGVDPHTGWRRITQGSIDYSPLRARTGQQVWRGLSALLALSEGENRAAVLSWVAALEARGVQSVSLLVTSTKFGNMSTTIEDLLSDRLDTPVAVLRTEDLEAATLAGYAVHFADAAARALGFVSDASFVKHNDETDRYEVPEGKRIQASASRNGLAEELYSALDAPYRHFLMELGSSELRAMAIASWAATVTAAARAVARRRLAELPASQAFAGASCELRFERALRKAREDFNPLPEEKGVA
jgi:CRISPR system Cascade subunit CasA